MSDKPRRIAWHSGRNRWLMAAVVHCDFTWYGYVIKEEFLWHYHNNS